MKTYVYMGANARNASGVSYKVWKIQCSGKVVQAWWGPAEVVRRTLKPNWRQTSQWRHATECKAEADDQSRIKEKLKSGYKPRRASRRG